MLQSSAPRGALFSHPAAKTTRRRFTAAVVAMSGRCRPDVNWVSSSLFRQRWLLLAALFLAAGASQAVGDEPLTADAIGKMCKAATAHVTGGDARGNAFCIHS